MTQVTIVGGGIGGLVAAVAAREAGHEVTLHEARERLGGRGWTLEGPYKANWGCHVLYADGPMWRWLDERRLTKPFTRAPGLPKIVLRSGGDGRRTPPPRTMSAAIRLRRGDAPVDRSFTEWGREVVGDERAVAQVASLIGVATFHHDPGSLSAAFVAERLRRATKLPPSVRYVTGGWGALVDRVSDHARSIGVRIETSSPVDALPEGGPVVLAVPLAAASKLLGSTVSWTGTRTALLDVAVTARRGDPFAVGDLEESGWAETFSMPDPTIAPPGEHLVQAQIGMRTGESLDDAIARAERLLDAGYRGWRTRETWRRRARIEDETGAVDLPGTSWRDRPAVDRGDDVYLVGDMVAAPGLLAEVSHAAALTAVAAISTRGSRLVGAHDPIGRRR